ncbi:MAG: cytochrome c class [Gemmatimonadetes bacterium]|nr:cytochrome c class [Gemmatimonadota bacterium]
MHPITRIAAVCIGAALSRSALCAQATPAAARTPRAGLDVPSWAFPLPAPAPAAALDSVTLLHVPRSSQAFTAVQVRNQFAIPDWHPDTHPAMPPIVAHGRKPTVIACGFCHLPNGVGRPENATLAGLPAAYIVQQVADIKSRARQSAWEGPFRPMELMRAIADSSTDADIAAAARYFSRIRPHQRARVVEARDIPRPIPALGLYFPAESGSVEPLGQRLIEMPVEPERHEMRDAEVEYVAYVPPGSIARGRALAITVTRTAPKPCASCHGPQLRGVGLVPPIAGRSPSYILRQLLAFKTGRRAAPASAPMRDVAATLSLDDMIAAAAYAGSRKP